MESNEHSRQVVFPPVQESGKLHAHAMTVLLSQMWAVLGPETKQSPRFWQRLVARDFPNISGWVPYRSHSTRKGGGGRVQRWPIQDSQFLPAAGRQGNDEAVERRYLAPERSLSAPSIEKHFCPSFRSVPRVVAPSSAQELAQRFSFPSTSPF